MILTKPIHLTVLIAVCSIAPSAAASDIDLSSYRWKHRLLLVFAASTNDNTYSKLNGRIKKAALEPDDRDMIIFRIFESGPSQVANNPLSRTEAEALRRRHNVPSGQLTVVLVGKDGGV